MFKNMEKKIQTKEKICFKKFQIGSFDGFV
jgi:hypothetical protein